MVTEKLGLYIGPFASIPDALLVEEYLEGTYGVHSVLGVLDIEEGAGLPVAVFDFLPFTFGKSRYDLDFHSLPKLDESHILYNELKAYDTQETRDQYLNLLKNVRNEVSIDDPVRGYIELNIGITHLLNGEYSNALGCLLPVAKGKINAAANHRLMAMWRVAWIYHHEGERLRAYRLYRETAELGNHDWVTARTSTEIAGLLLEFAKNEEYGHYELVRTEIDSMLAGFPDGYPDLRSTTELIRIESYYYEGRLEDCVEQGRQFIREIKGTEPRQEVMARLFVGLSEHMLGDSNAGIVCMEEGLQIELGPKERWEAIPDPHLRTLKYLERVSREAGYIDKAAYFATRAEERRNAN